jgi:hypothetical protein
VIYRKDFETSEKNMKKNSFLIESLLSTTNNKSSNENSRENLQETNESDSNSCNSSTCSSRPISPGCENESFANEKEEQMLHYPFPHPLVNFQHPYPNLDLFYNPRNFYYENYEFNRKLLFCKQVSSLG